MACQISNPTIFQSQLFFLNNLLIFPLYLLVYSHHRVLVFVPAFIKDYNLPNYCQDIQVHIAQKKPSNPNTVLGNMSLFISKSSTMLTLATVDSSPFIGINIHRHAGILFSHMWLLSKGLFTISLWKPCLHLSKQKHKLVLVLKHHIVVYIMQANLKHELRFCLHIQTW